MNICQLAKTSSIQLHALPKLSRVLSVDLWVVRDDLLPYYGGGNKARKLQCILESLPFQACNAVVTCGGVQSNHARATALAAAQRGWACKIILHGDRTALGNPTGNLLLMRLAGAEVEIVAPEEIAERMEAAMDHLAQAGCRPALLPGGGHVVAGAEAYIQAVHDLAKNGNLIPEWIVHPSGTGTTQAGIHQGIGVLGWTTRVVGISVARTNPRGKQCVQDMIEQACKDLHLQADDRPVEFRDEWTAGGYEKVNKPIIAAIELAARSDGLLLDPTYTGKAFAGMVDLIRSGSIPKHSRVVFWHTGGLPNLLASSFHEMNKA